VIFRPLVDTIVVALDDATGGLYTQIKQLSKGNVDPLALLQAMVDAQQAAADAMANPASAHPPPSAPSPTLERN
jgi:hypothetical protein